MMSNFRSRSASLVLAMLIPVSAAAVICTVAGCTREKPRTVTAMGRTATVEEKGKQTKVTLEGPEGKTVVTMRQAEVLDRIDLPLFPGAKVVPGSEREVESKELSEKTYSARLKTDKTFDEVLEWYRKQLGASATTASVAGARYALIAKPSDRKGQARTVLVKRAPDDTQTDVTLMLVAEYE